MDSLSGNDIRFPFYHIRTVRTIYWRKILNISDLWKGTIIAIRIIWQENQSLEKSWKKFIFLLEFNPFPKVFSKYFLWWKTLSCIYDKQYLHYFRIRSWSGPIRSSWSWQGKATGVSLSHLRHGQRRIHFQWRTISGKRS